MCGLFATTRPDLWREKISEVLRCLEHRGPDAHGVWESPDGSVLLAHTRLSILGLGPDGAQPLHLPSGMAITYNGEIYNFRDLAGGLGPKAARSDTQTLLRMLERDGAAALPLLRGMYAFAWWDQRTNTLSAARDPWGIKPLYLLDHASGGVTISSEIGPLILLDEARQVDPIGLAQYVAFGHTGQTLTCYEHIRKIPPGTIFQWSIRASGRPGADLTTQRIHGQAPTPVLPVADAVHDAVRAHLVADVEVGMFLSGGVDSTLLAAFAREQNPSLRAFTISFPDMEPIDETRLAEHNARELGVRHCSVPVTTPAMVRALDRLLATTGEPFGDAAALPLTVLSSTVAQELKVVLTGEGADELFGGYGRYRVSRWLPVGALPFVAPLGSRLADTVYQRRTDRPRGRALEALLRAGGADSHASLLGSDLPVIRQSPVGDDVSRILRTDWKALTGEAVGRDAARQFDLGRWLPNMYLEKTDRATMSSGLEARTPYLDPVVALAARQPRQFGKHELLSALMSRCPGVRLPDRKKGLAVPIEQLMAGGLRADVDRALNSRESVLRTALGDKCVALLSHRARLSPSTAYRIAVLARWEANCDVRS
jgi:asparagine synthase (glutamine-hydrolysing)